MPKILYLLDGHALAYRAYFALTAGGGTRWSTSSGEPTAGIYGFASILLRIFETEMPDYMAISFDPKRTFRHDMYDGYKATRAKMPEDLRPQIERIREMVDCFNIPRVEVENFEADDVIGSLSKWAVDKEALGVKIITGDRDLFQLVNDRVVVQLPGTKPGVNEDYFPEDVFKRMGVRPDQIVDYKALVGDSSDNIPGVRGIGEKTATGLLAQYQTLDNIYAHLDEISGRAGTALGAGKADAYLSQDLAQIRTDLAVKLDLKQADIKCFEPAAVEELFRALEFRTLTQRLQALIKRINPAVLKPSFSSQASLFGEEVDEMNTEEATSTTETTQDFETVIVDSEAKLETCLRELSGAKRLALDTETTSTNPMQAELVGISLAGSAEKGYYIPLAHQSGRQLALETVRKALQPLFEDPKIGKVGHHAKYDFVVLEQHGVSVAPLVFDTMIAEWLVNPDSHNLGLKAQAWLRLGVDMTHIEELIGKGKNQLRMDQVPIAKAAPYAAADAVMTWRLVEPLQKDLESHKAEHLNRDIEIKLIPVLTRMEENGILLDKALFANFGAELSGHIARLEEQIYLESGQRFNIGSTAQVSDVLFKHLNLEPPDRSKKTASGKFSTAAGVLEDMRGSHAVVDHILEWRELTKLQSTYVETLPLQVNPKTGRVHTSFNQCGTVTGRIASQNPNLQNIPTRTDLGRRVRQGFIAPKGSKLVALDYSQVELRIMADMSGDEEMRGAFLRGEDIHTATAAAILGINLNAVSKAQRRHAKAINFGLIYGMSPFGLTRTTDLTLAEAENFVKAYFAHYPKVKAWLDHTRMEATQQGYVETKLGRRRYFPNLQAGTNYMMRQREEREAINAPIQGTAADIIKIAMIGLPEALLEAKLQSKMLLQVHDELIFESPEEEVEKLIHVAKGVMEAAMSLAVPLIADAKVGSNWAELEPVDDLYVEVFEE
ncbi:MAG: DNA polymerase I [Anaerolineaceae bacterium]|nr:DNA polymerase I [Anaerolineaceae bacterium]